MTENESARLVREIHAGLRGRVDEQTVLRTVSQALADLGGSVPPGALPEMAARLAVTRLDSLS